MDGFIIPSIKVEFPLLSLCLSLQDAASSSSVEIFPSFQIHSKDISNPSLGPQTQGRERQPRKPMASSPSVSPRLVEFNLPRSLLQSVFGYLDHTSFTAAAQVCRSWSETAYDAENSIYDRIRAQQELESIRRKFQRDGFRESVEAAREVCHPFLPSFHSFFPSFVSCRVQGSLECFPCPGMILILLNRMLGCSSVPHGCLPSSPTGGIAERIRQWFRAGCTGRSTVRGKSRNWNVGNIICFFFPIPIGHCLFTSPILPFDPSFLPFCF